MNKKAEVQFPIHDLIAERWSPLAFSDQAVSREDLGSLFEAARWAASCYNEQPWSFIVATRDETELHAKLASCLVEANAAWAAQAPVLLLSVASMKFSRNGKHNRHGAHDLGLAVGNLSMQAGALGLSLHQMGGFDVQRARELFAIPEDLEPMAAIALGYRGDGESLSAEMRTREAAVRERKALNEMVFGANWGEAWSGIPK